jgi:hypothetical protein
LGLGRELAVLQAAMFDGLLLDGGTLSEDLADRGRSRHRRAAIAQTIVIAPRGCVLDEGLDLGFRIAQAVVVFQQDAVFNVWCQRSILPCVCGWKARRARLMACASISAASSPAT